MKKRLIMPLVIAGVVISITLGVAAGSNLKEIKALINSNIKVKINNNVVQLKDKDGSELNPIIYNSKTYVPLKSISDLLNVNVGWDEASSSVLLGQLDASGELTKLEGTYINKQYLKELNAQKSIASSHESSPYIWIEKLAQGSKNYYLGISIGFHQDAGGEVRAFSKLTKQKEEVYNDKGEKQIKEMQYYSINNCKYILKMSTENDINSIELLGDFGVNHEYIKIDESIGTYINRALFDGSYKDESGKTFIFDGDNITWDNKKFKYSVKLDVSEISAVANKPIDLITITYNDKMSEQFGFKFENNNLFLYKTSYDKKDGYEKIVVDTTPYLTLQKVNTK